MPEKSCIRLKKLEMSWKRVFFTLEKKGAEGAAPIKARKGHFQTE